MSEVKITIAQSPAELDGIKARLNWLQNTLASYNTENTDLLLLPELFVTGYNIGAEVKNEQSLKTAR